MAEGIFRHLVEEAGLSDRVVVDSAGTGSWHIGEQAHRGTRQVLQKHGIHYSGRARQITLDDLDNYDYILAMDHDNLSALRRLAGNNSRAEMRLFMDYADGMSGSEVPDPYYSGRFEEVYQLVRAGAEGLLAHIRQQYGL